MKSIFPTLCLVFIGGGLGSLLRYALSPYNSTTLSNLPYGTLLANGLSCLVLGLVTGLYVSHPDVSTSHRLFWATGFCGGFSTFSTFMLETHRLLEVQHLMLSLLYVVGSVVVCYLALFAGMWLGRLFY